MPSTLAERDRDAPPARERGEGDRARDLKPHDEAERGEREAEGGEGDEAAEGDEAEGEGDEGGGDEGEGPASRPAETPFQTETRLYLRFLVAWSVLNVCLNSRYPALRNSDPHRFWFLPSPDVTVIFGLFCLLGWRRKRVPGVAVGVLVALAVAVRLMRFGDGISLRFFNRAFSVVTDSLLLGELTRLLWSTSSHAKVVVGAVLAGAALVGLCLALRAALRHAEGYLARPAGRAAFLATAAVFFALSWVVPPPLKPDHRWGAFATSAAGRLALETDFLLHVLGLRDRRWEPVREANARVEALPKSLPGLGGADVFFIFVESYGHVVVSEPEVRSAIEPVWETTGRELEQAGYGVRSSWLVSSTYGGGSWLAHSSLASGTRIDDQFAYGLIARAEPKSMAWAFRRAGYRTLLVAPGVTRPWTQEGFFNFDKVYHSWDFGYRGPRFSWATMPDQFVLDRVHRREIEGHEGPLFAQFILVSSHAPFDTQPTYVHDWSTIDDGSIFRDLVPIRYPGLTWSNQGLARAAYARSLGYDFQVLSQYLTQFLSRRALVIMVGDHQPTPALTDHDPDWSVPIHVLSRDPELLAPFERRGYGVGMKPAGEPRGMETFLFTLFEMFSQPPPAGR